jgi:predicted Zn finger-like uncharacterized protein
VQAQCSQCSAPIRIDDSKVPDKPFKVKCPKCQAVITLPGKGAAPAGNGGAEAAAPPAAPPPAYDPPQAPSPAAVARRERAAASQNDALVALSGPAAAPIQAALTNLGYTVDVVEDAEEGVRLIEQGVYELAVTSRAPGADPGKETLYQRLQRLATDYRRGVFVILVGEDFRTGDGTQAWVAQADLVVHPNDAARAEHLIHSTIQERKRLYLPLHDARKRIENS